MFDDFPSGNEFCKFVSDNFEHKKRIEILDSNLVRIDGFCSYKVSEAGGIITSYEKLCAL